MRNFLFLSVVSLFLAACSATKPISLDLSPESNSEFTYVSTIETINNVKVMGMDQSTVMNQTIEMAYKINEVAADGSTDLTMTTKNISMEQSMPMMKMVFDSKNPERNEPADMVKGFENLVGQQYEVSLDSKGKVTAVESKTDVFDGVFEDVPQGEMLAEQMETMFGKGAIKQAFNQLTGFYPEQPVKVGDTWNIKSQTNAGMQLDLDMNYTLKSRANGIAIISFDGNLATDPNGAPMEMMGMKIKYNMKGTQTGEMKVDEKTGWAIFSEGVQKMSGTASMSGEMLGGADMNVEMEMDNTFKSERQ